MKEIIQYSYWKNTACLRFLSSDNPECQGYPESEIRTPGIQGIANLSLHITWTYCWRNSYGKRMFLTQRRHDLDTMISFWQSRPCCCRSLWCGGFTQGERDIQKIAVESTDINPDSEQNVMSPVEQTSQTSYLSLYLTAVRNFLRSTRMVKHCHWHYNIH